MDKIAIINLESVMAKLVVAGSENAETIKILDTEVEEVSLRLDQEDYFLKKPQIDGAIRVLKNFRKICEMHGVRKTIAVANFVQDIKPKNISSFFDEVFATCGFRFTVPSADEQNNAFYTGIINTYDMPKGVAACILADSVQLVEYNRRTLVNSNVMNFGPATLLDMYPIADLGVANAFAKMEKYIDTQLSDASWLGKNEGEISFIGGGRFYTDLAKMVRKFRKYPLDKDDCLEIDKTDAEKIYEQLKAMDLSPTKRLKGIDEPRADMFVAALAIIVGIFKAADRDKIVVVSRGSTEGLLLEELVPSTQEKPISDVLGFGLNNNLAHLSEEERKHCDQVFNLAMLLYKQLRVLHKLPRGYLKVLRIASVLHDSGKCINYIDHAKYSYNFILGADIYGAGHREIVLAAFVASLHSGGDLSIQEWVKYKDILTEEDLDAVKKLGVMLRLAECLDRIKNGAVVDINCDILGDSVIMKTVAAFDAEYQIGKALECGREFERQFHKKLEIL